MSEYTKFGITAPVPGVSVEGLLDFVYKSERGGFDTVWFPDHVVFMADKLTPEVWSVITAAAPATKTIAMGAVGDAHRIHPSVYAHRLATVDHIAGGRVFACLGYGEKMNLDPYGIKWDNPLKRVAESVEVMRSLWTGEVVNFEGEIYSLDDAVLRIKPVSESGVPIYIAATGPRALEVAGKYGDGWLTNAMPTGLFKSKAKAVLEQSDARPKGLGEIEKSIYIFVSIADNEDEAYNSLAPVKHALIWPELLAEAGYDIEIDDKYKGLQYTKIMPNDKEMLAKFREMGQRYYSREILMDFVIAGSKERVIERFEEYIDAGVDHFVLRDFSPDRERSFEILTKEIIPHFHG